MTGSPLHDWALPRLTALIADAEQAGFAPDATVAVLTDLVCGPVFNHAPLPVEPPVLDPGQPGPLAAEMETPELALPRMVEAGEFPFFAQPYGGV